MNLPQLFLADLEDPSVLTPALVRDACIALKNNRDRNLVHRPTSSIISALIVTAENWLSSDYPLRQYAASLCPEKTGFTAPVLLDGLDRYFRQCNAANFNRLIQQDAAGSAALEDFTASAAEQATGRAFMARGPELLAEIAGGKLAVPIIHQCCLGLLARSAQFIKCPAGGSILPRLFGHALHEVDPKLAACIEIADWPGGAEPLEQELFAAAPWIVATGADATLQSIRSRIPANCRFVGYGHRVSFAYATREALSGFAASRIVQRAALDVAAWDQSGCLSPHCLYVERGPGMAPETFAENLAEQLAQLQITLPRAPLSPAAAAEITSRRAFYRVRAAHSAETKLWASPDSTAWTVVYEADPLFQPSCLNRFIYVKSAESLRHVLRAADRIRGQVSTVGLAATDDRAQGLARELSAWGVTRICPIGRMQDPPLVWRHDGRPALGDLLQWTDWELFYEH